MRDTYDTRIVGAGSSRGMSKLRLLAMLASFTAYDDVATASSIAHHVEVGAPSPRKWPVVKRLGFRPTHR